MLNELKSAMIILGFLALFVYFLVGG